MTKVLLLGSKGRLGAALHRNWQDKYQVTGLARPELDMADLDRVRRLLDAHSTGANEQGEAEGYDVVVNCTGMTNLEKCEDEPDLAERINAEAVQLVAQHAAERNCRMIHFGTDYVYDGTLDRPYTESDKPNPQGVYATSKCRGEEAVLATSPQHAVFRVSWVFGPDKPSFVDMVLGWGMEKEKVEAVADKTSSPSFTEDIAEWVEPFLSGSLPGGLYHSCNAGGCSWRDFGQHAINIASELGWPLKTRVVAPVPLSSMTFFRAPRPRHTIMDSSKLAKAIGHPLATWEDAVERFVRKLPRPPSAN